MDTELIEQNVHRLLGAMTGAATTAMVAVGDQLGLYRALAGGGPATPDELAQLAGDAGFSRFRQVPQTPVNVVLELRP
jgi:hypothetical protein